MDPDLKFGMKPEEPNEAYKKHVHWPILLAGALFIVAVLLVGYIVLSDSNDSENTQRESNVSSETGNEVPTVVITENGFEPEEILVLPGSIVRWINQDSEPHNIASDPYPESDLYPELNAPEPLGPGESFEIFVGESGSLFYHDSFNPTNNGVITIAEQN